MSNDPPNNGGPNGGGGWTGTGSTTLDSLLNVVGSIISWERTEVGPEVPWQPGYALELNGRGGIYSWERNRVSIVPRQYSSFVGGNLDLEVRGNFDTLVNHDLNISIGKLPDPEEPEPAAEAELESGSEDDSANNGPSPEALANLEAALLAFAQLFDDGSTDDGADGEQEDSAQEDDEAGEDGEEGADNEDEEDDGPTQEEMDQALADLEAQLAALSGSEGDETGEQSELQAKIDALQQAINDSTPSGPDDDPQEENDNLQDGPQVSDDVQAAVTALLEQTQADLESGSETNGNGDNGEESEQDESGNENELTSGSGIDATPWGLERLSVDGNMHWTFDEKMLLMSGSVNRVWLGGIMRMVPMEGVICGGAFMRVHAGPQMTVAGISSGDVYGGCARFSGSRVYMSGFSYRSTDAAHWIMGYYGRFTAVTVEPVMRSPSATRPTNHRTLRRLGRLSMALCPFIGITVGMVMLLPSLGAMVASFIMRKPQKPPTGPPRVRNRMVGAEQVITAGSLWF